VLVEYPAVGGPIVLGPAAGAAAFSPNGTLLASVVHYSAGTASLVVSSANGSNPATLAQSQSDITSIAWASNRRLLYATASAIKAVELTGVSHTVAEPPGASSVQLSPDAAWAYLAPVGDAGGQLLDIETGRRQPLAGAGQSVSFSADGTAIGWVDRSQTPQRVQTQLLTTGARVAVSPLDAGDNLDAVALSANATAIAYLERPATGQAHLVVAQLPSGAVVAVGPEVSSVAFSPDGRSLALINSAAPSSTVQRAALPGATEPSEAAGLPASARTAVQAFIDAQVGYDTQALTALSTGAAAAIPSTPKGISRGYLVSAAANSDGSITATAELIVDSSGTHPLPQKSEETLTFARAPGGSAYLVTAVTAGPLRDELPGPHVVTVTTVVQHGGAVVQINFDSDLERSSVPAAITLVTSDGTVLAGQVVYDADTRSATVTLAAVPSSPITVNVGASLRDVDGQAIAGSFATRAGF